MTKSKTEANFSRGPPFIPAPIINRVLALSRLAAGEKGGGQEEVKQAECGRGLKTCTSTN